MAAAYRLGRVGARQLLARALTAEDEGTARAAAYGLTAAGPAATSSVLPLLSGCAGASDHGRADQADPAERAQRAQRADRARRLAAFVVGETAKPEASTIAMLGRALRELSELSEESSKEAKCELLEARGQLNCFASDIYSVLVEPFLPRLYDQ